MSIYGIDGFYRFYDYEGTIPAMDKFRGYISHLIEAVYKC